MCFKEAKSETLTLKMLEIKQNCELTKLYSKLFRLKSIDLKYYISFNTAGSILVPDINFLNFP